MLLIFIYLSFIREALAGITDLNCTYGPAANAKYSEAAFLCPNVIADSVCAKLYDKELAVDGDAERSDNCFKNGQNPDEAFKQAAISTCPRRCGYCCMTPEFNCPNKQFPRISCSAITRAMCLQAAWRDILTEDCPNICGTCTSGNCTDVAPNCGKDLSICRNIFMQAFVQENCKRTCGYCSQTNTSTATSADCGTDPNCANWVRNGFCSSYFYTQEQKKRYCGRACGLC